MAILSSTKPARVRLRPAFALMLSLFATACAHDGTAGDRLGENQIPITFSGGHDTDPRDGGRPVVLVAAALDVTPEVFRKAFSGVTPARNDKPSPDQARQNKAALLKVLKPLGVSNERLDEVSDYYRYRPKTGELWKTTSAKAYAVVENGQIQRIVVTDPGSGYSTPPTATVDGTENTPLRVELDFSTDLKKNGAIRFKKNGAIRSVELIPPEKQKSAE